MEAEEAARTLNAVTIPRIPGLRLLTPGEVTATLVAEAAMVHLPRRTKVDMAVAEAPVELAGTRRQRVALGQPLVPSAATVARGVKAATEAPVRFRAGPSLLACPVLAGGMDPAALPEAMATIPTARLVHAGLTITTSHGCRAGDMLVVPARPLKASKVT